MKEKADPTPDPAAVAAQHKRLIREAIAGYAVMNEVIDQERIERLRKMTPQQSWAIFEDLIAFGRKLQGDPATLKVFEPRRIEEHVYMRQIFEKLAKAQGLV